MWASERRRGSRLRSGAFEGTIACTLAACQAAKRRWVHATILRQPATAVAWQNTGTAVPRSPTAVGRALPTDGQLNGPAPPEVPGPCAAPGARLRALAAAAGGRTGGPSLPRS